MSYLKVTLIDVGWGDSILIEASDGNSRPRFAIIDSNDNAEREYWPTRNFLRKHFGNRENEFTVEKPFFDFVMISHDHSDHGTGLKRIMKDYGTNNFWYPKVVRDESVIITHLQDYTDHHNVNINNQAIDTEDELESLGDVSMEILWPPPFTPDQIEPNPNNNSIVLLLTIGEVSFLLTGDAEGEVWNHIASDIPQNTKVVKVPHHGSRNGILHGNTSPLIDRLDTFADKARLGISCHPNYPNRFDFPHQEVLNRIGQRPYDYFRTDLHYHVTFAAENNQVRVIYSH